MSCSPRLPRPEQPDLSDYGSDFSPEEDELLNELLAKAVAPNATVHSNATPSSPSNLIPAATPVTPTRSVGHTTDPKEIESRQPAVFAALVADIEDGIEDSPGVRLPKVLGREKPRSPERQSSQRFRMVSQGARICTEGTSSTPNNRSSLFGRCSLESAAAALAVI